MDLAWYQLDIDLPSSPTVGPFSPVRVATQSGHGNNRVPDAEQDRLCEYLPRIGLDITDVHRHP